MDRGKIVAKEVPTNFFKMGKDPEWILNGQYVDRALFRNRLAFDLFSSFGDENRYATETKFCEMTLNGTYKGVYTLGEKIDRDDDRLDIQEGATPGDSFIVKLSDTAGFHPNEVGYGTWERATPSASSPIRGRCGTDDIAERGGQG